MKIIVQSLVLGFGISQAGLSTQYPITIDCKDGEPVSTRLQVQLSPALNLAKLHYESAGKTMSMTIDKPRGLYSSSAVTINSKSQDSRLLLEIAAQSTEIYRVTSYAQFSLNVAQNEQGAFRATELLYRRGIDAFPDTHDEGSISLQNMSCTVSGL